jgi:ABC-2 type transport system permease protein
VGQAALRDFSTGAGALIFSAPIHGRAYLAGRFLGGYVAAMLALTAGVIAMAVTQVVLKGSDPAVGPISWGAFVYGVVSFLAPNVLLVGSMIFLLALWSRSMGRTFLGLLAIVLCQDLAEALPVATFGYRIPALLDPLGLAALKAVTRTWSVKQYASSMPPLSGDLLLNRGLWMLMTIASLSLSGAVFTRRARRSDQGEKAGRRRTLRRRLWSMLRSDARDGTRPASGPLGMGGVVAHLPEIATQTGARMRWKQFLAILRFELQRMLGSLSYKVILGCGLALVYYGMEIGEHVVGVRSIPNAQTIANVVERASRLTLTLMIVLFSAEVVWRERMTRMDLTIDSFPTGNGTTVAGKMLALLVLVMGSIGIFGALAWGLQVSQSANAATLGQVAMIVTHVGLGYLQLAAIALLLQTLAGGPMAGYVAVGVFLALRIALRSMGLRSDLFAFAGAKLPAFSEMDQWGHTLPRFFLVQMYWTKVSVVLALLAGYLWPRGVVVGFGARLTRARLRFSVAGAATLALGVLVAALGGLHLHRSTLAADMGWNRDATEAFLADYERDFREWRGRPRPEVVDMQADVDLDATGRRLRVRGSYGLHNGHGEAIEEMLLGYDPDLLLHGLGFGGPDFASGAEFKARVEQTRSAGTAFVAGVLPGAAASRGTHVVRFDPPLLAGASIQLDFDLEFNPPGLGARPADSWLRENGTFLSCGPGTHPAFRGAQFFPTLGYDDSRELQDTRPRGRQGLGAWEGLITPEAYRRELAAGGSPQGFGSSDWATVELWIHTDEDQLALGPGELLEQSLDAGQAHFHYRTEEAISAFFPIVSGRYDKVVARAGEVDLELYYHPDHGARVAHILWAMERSLAYFEEHWGPCPTRIIRMGEIPGLSSFACSFPGGMMAFTENMAFTLPEGDGQAIEFPARNSAQASLADVDPLLWIVAHEIAHQWWDCYVLPAQAQGSTFASESLAQYGSLCVMQEEYGDEVALRMVEYNYHTYLTGRARANRAEKPLVHVDDQAHLHYGKGYMAFHSLAQLAGRGAIDRALTRLVNGHGGSEGLPITSLDLFEALEEELPAQYASHLDEWVNHISFLETSVSKALATPNDGGGFTLSVDCMAQGVRSDGEGEETAYEYTGPLELDVYFDEGVDTRRLEVNVKGARALFEGSFEHLPTAVRVDPRLLHIDRDLVDNQRSVKEIK